MASLSGNKIKDTYQSLIKLTDNGNLTTGAKQLTDGFGNNSPLYISTTQIGIGVTPEATYDLHVYQNAKVGGNLTITGDLTVNGTTTTVDTDTLRVEDPLIEVARNNTSSDAVDIGIYGKYAPSGTTLYAGLFRDTGDDKFKLFKSLEEQPTTTVNTSGTGYAVATLVANVEGTLTGIIASTTTATTQSANDNSTKVATTAYVDNQVGLFDTLSEVLANGNTTGGTDIAVSANDDITFTDSSKAIFDGNLQIYSDGSYNYIHCTSNELRIRSNTLRLLNSAGTANYITADNLQAVQLYYNNSKKFETTSTGVTVTGELTVSGTGQSSFGGQVTIPATPSASTDAASKGYVDSQVGANNELSEVLANGNTTGGTDIAVSSGDDITFTDGSIARFGSDNDFDIYHNGTNAFIKNATGTLYITNTGTDQDIWLQSDDGSGGETPYVKIDGSTGAVELNHYGSKKFETTSTGAKVTGSNFNVFAASGATKLEFGQTNGNWKIEAGNSGNNTLIIGSVSNATNNITLDTTNGGSATFAGRVGIGQSAGTAKLEVAGEARVYTGSNLGYWGVDSGNSYVYLGTNTSGYGLSFQTAGTERMRIDSSGNVKFNSWIRGTSDTNMLYSSTGTGLLLQAPSNSGTGGIIHFRNASGTVFQTFSQVDGNATFAGDVTVTGGDLTLGTDSIASNINAVGDVLGINVDSNTGGGAGANIQLKTAGTTQLTINSSSATFAGKVGIGGTTITDSNLLNLQGSSASVNIGVVFNDTNTSKIFGIQNGGSALKVFDYSASAERVRIDSSGNVGIGTDSPNAKLEIGTAGGTAKPDALRISNAINYAYYWDIWRDNLTGYLNFGSATGGSLTTQVTIKDVTGNVGIGETSPDFKLHVKDTQTSDTAKLQLRLEGNNGNYYDLGRNYNTGFFEIQGNQTGYNNIILAPDSGNVGIGTASPDLTGFGYTTLTVVGGTTAGYAGVLELGSPTTNANGQNLGIIAFMDGSTRNAQIDVTRASSTSTSNMHFYTNGGSGIQERMRITSGGNINLGSGSLTQVSYQLRVDSDFDNGMYMSAGSSSGNYAMYIESGAGSALFNVRGDGNVGIGLTTPIYPLDVATSGNLLGRFASSGTTSELQIVSPTVNVIQLDTGTSDVLAFGTTGTERMRIDSSGRLLIGKTSTGLATVGIEAAVDTLRATKTNSAPVEFNRGGTDGDIVLFYKDTAIKGSVSITSSAVAYNTSSDYRLKENVVEMTNALDRVSQLKPSRFNFIGHEEIVDGFLAHEVSDIVPEAITGTKDEVDAEGNPVYQGIDQSKLVPLLVGAIQELQKRIEILENK